MNNYPLIKHMSLPEWQRPAVSPQLVFRRGRRNIFFSLHACQHDASYYSTARKFRWKCRVQFLCLHQARLASGGIIFSSCPFLRSFVCPSVNLWTQYLENQWTEFDADWHKWSTRLVTVSAHSDCLLLGAVYKFDYLLTYLLTRQGHETINFRRLGGQRQSHTRPKIDLEAWRMNYSRPHGSSSFCYECVSSASCNVCLWS